MMVAIQRHLAKQTKGAAARKATRKAALRKLETSLSNLSDQVELQGPSETLVARIRDRERELEQLRAEASAEADNIVQIPTDIGAIYRRYVNDLTATLSGSDVVGRASEKPHVLIEILRGHPCHRVPHAQCDRASLGARCWKAVHDPERSIRASAASTLSAAVSRSPRSSSATTARSISA